MKKLRAEEEEELRSIHPLVREIREYQMRDDADHPQK
jgi:hypothetical protein